MLYMSAVFFKALAYILGLKLLGFEASLLCLAGFRHLSTGRLYETVEIMREIDSNPTAHHLLSACFSTESGNPSKPRSTDVPRNCLDGALPFLQIQFETLANAGVSQSDCPPLRAATVVTLWLKIIDGVFKHPAGSMVGGENITIRSSAQIQVGTELVQ